jgi:hypothetical protein
MQWKIRIGGVFETLFIYFLRGCREEGYACCLKSKMHKIIEMSRFGFKF